MIEMVAPGSMPPLPDGFTEKYTKETAASDDPSSFADKETLLTAYRAQRQATLAALEGLDEARLDEATGVDYADHRRHVSAASRSLAHALWTMGGRTA
ncbi:MAG: hypothetical protein R3B96_01575 [Pirellulaceae bacterium]